MKLRQEEIVKIYSVAYLASYISQFKPFRAYIFRHTKKECLFDATTHHVFFLYFYALRFIFIVQSKLRQMKVLFIEKLFIAGILP